jgi:hypothetical protein
MDNELTSVVDVCDRLVKAGMFPDATAFWLGFLTYAYRNGPTGGVPRVPEALAWVEAGGLADIGAPQTRWFFNEFCRWDVVVEEARSYLHFRELDHLFAASRRTHLPSNEPG